LSTTVTAKVPGPGTGVGLARDRARAARGGRRNRRALHREAISVVDV